MRTDLVKGFKDYLGENAEKKAIIQEIVRSTFERYGFSPAETPIIEYEEFVQGENISDEVISDIFRLTDKGKRKLALRYELTFPLKRISQNKKLPFKRYQIGEVFRDEPVSAYRWRQFRQCDADIIGSTVKDEAEVFAMINEILDKLKIDSVIYFNNRKLLNEILEELKISKKDEVIREIDKLDKLPEKIVKENLKKYNAEKILSIIKQKISYFEKYKSYSEIKELKQYCKNYGVKIIFAPFLARGLSYYNGTVFEVKTKQIKETIFGGGAYNFNNNQSFGFGVSLERLMAVTNMIVNLEKFLIVSLNQDKQAIGLAKQLRMQNKNVSMFYGKPSKALEYANSYKIKNVIFVGKKEVEKKIFKIKDMTTGREKVLTIVRKVSRR